MEKGLMGTRPVEEFFQRLPNKSLCNLDALLKVPSCYRSRLSMPWPLKSLLVKAEITLAE